MTRQAGYEKGCTGYDDEDAHDARTAEKLKARAADEGHTIACATRMVSLGGQCECDRQLRKVEEEVREAFRRLAGESALLERTPQTNDCADKPGEGG